MTETYHSVVCGPSGVGKTTLIKLLMKQHPDRFGYSVSHTTRPKRDSEVDGIDYYFTSDASMREAIQQNQFLEFECVHGHLYGTSIRSVIDVIERNRVCILDIDVQGVQDLMKREPPSLLVLSQRLHKRGSEDEETIQVRLKNSQKEMEAAHRLPFSLIIHYDSVESAYKQLCKYLGLSN